MRPNYGRGPSNTHITTVTHEYASPPLLRLLPSLKPLASTPLQD